MALIKTKKVLCESGRTISNELHFMRSAFKDSTYICHEIKCFEIATC